MQNIITKLKPVPHLKDLSANKPEEYEVFVSNLNLLDNFIKEYNLSTQFFTKQDEPQLKETYLEVRTRQNDEIAMRLTEEGISIFKSMPSNKNSHSKDAENTRHSSMQKSLQKYNQAIGLARTCVPAYVARGCLFYAQANFKQSLNDFQYALSLDAGNKNAKAYLGIVKIEIDKLEADSPAPGEFVLPSSFTPGMRFKHDQTTNTTTHGRVGSKRDLDIDEKRRSESSRR